MSNLRTRLSSLAVLAVLGAPAAGAQEVIQTPRGPGLLIHGNYCGPGNRGPAFKPIDALDAACMRHDACYDTAGYSSCACDATLRREAGAVSDSPDVALEVRRRALSVIEATAAMQCRGP